MPNVSAAKNLVKSDLTQAILATLAFFDIYALPLPARKVWELLYKVQAPWSEAEAELIRLARLNIIVYRDGMYALREWDEKKYKENQAEIDKRWTRIRKYYWLLSAIPFVEHISVINSVAMGNADNESDIDFFVVTQPNRLYFVRSVIIVLFKLLGVYKNRRSVNMKFCFGFYVTTERMNIKDVMLPDSDPYFIFWLGTMTPILSLKYYERFLKENRWIYTWLPNLTTMSRLDLYRKLKPNTGMKKILETLLYLPAILLEPLARRVHIKHTFNLPENHWASSTTIADRNILKLHALDPRKEVRQKFKRTLQNYT